MTAADPPPPTPSVLALRPRTPDDEALVRHLHATVREPELAATGWPEVQITSFLRSQFDAQEAHLVATHPRADRSVVLFDGEPIGRLDVDRSGDEIRLLEVVLLPEHRGRGLGTTVLAALLAEADARRLPLRLHVEATNPARALYERVGLRVVAEHGIHLAMERLPTGSDAVEAGAATDPSAAPVAGPSTPPADAVTVDSDGEAGFDLATLTADTLRPLVGDRFAVPSAGIELALVEVAVSSRTIGERVAFSLVFHGPVGGALDQGIHRLVHPEHGTLELFLVPLQPNDDTAPYEAVFG